MESFKKFLFKLNNDTAFFFKLFFLPFAIIFLIITSIFVKFTFYVDYSAECSKMESFIAENKEEICNLIKLSDSGEISLYDSDYTIDFNQDEVYLSTSNDNIFATELKVKVLVDKDNNNNVNLIIDNKYTHTDIWQGILTYSLLLFSLFLLEMFVFFLLHFIGIFVIYKKEN